MRQLYFTANPPLWLPKLDRLGSCLSFLCALHCLAMPLVIGFLPLLGLSFLGNRTFEQSVCALSIGLAFFCLLNGCRQHKKWGLFSLLLVGGGLIAHVQFFSLADDACTSECCEAHGTAAPTKEAGIMFLGGSLIATSHLLNRRFTLMPQKSCRNQDCKCN